MRSSSRERRYRRRVARLFSDWAQQDEWFFDEAMRRSGLAKRLRALRPPESCALAHGALLAAYEHARTRRAEGDALPILEAELALLGAGERLRAALDGAEDGRYADTVRDSLDASRRELDRAMVRAEALGARAVSRMRAVRAPAGREAEHAAAAAALAAYIDAAERQRRAMQAGDRDAALAGWRVVEERNAALNAALERASPDHAAG